MSSNILIEDLQCLRHEAGVYFLYDENKELVYIGESGNMYIRVLEHIAESKKDFNYFKAVPLDNNATRQLLEIYLISIIKPKYNELVVNDFVKFFKVCPAMVKNVYCEEDFNIFSTDIIKVDGGFNKSEFNKCFDFSSCNELLF